MDVTKNTHAAQRDFPASVQVGLIRSAGGGDVIGYLHSCTAPHLVSTAHNEDSSGRSCEQMEPAGPVLRPLPFPPVAVSCRGTGQSPTIHRHIGGYALLEAPVDAVCRTPHRARHASMRLTCSTSLVLLLANVWWRSLEHSGWLFFD